MRLYIEHDERLVVRDERGHEIPCVRSTTIHHRYRDATILTLEVVVDGDRVRLGSPVDARAETAPERVSEDEITRRELRDLIVRTMPGDRLTPEELCYSQDWDGYAFTWRGEHMIVRRDLVVLHSTDSGWNAETPLAHLVRRLLRQEAKCSEIAQRPPHCSHVWRAIEAVIEPGDISMRVDMVDGDGQLTGEVRFTWCEQRFRVDRQLRVERVSELAPDHADLTAVLASMLEGAKDG